MVSFVSHGTGSCDSRYILVAIVKCVLITNMLKNIFFYKVTMGCSFSLRKRILYRAFICVKKMGRFCINLFT
jgi:hypothetical protein